MTREKCIGQQGAMVVIKRSQIKYDRTRKLMPHAFFSHNPEYCVDIIHAHKP
ncbi:purine-nucleoside phosphorylase, partial [Salmonella enterica subsp. enterica serovar Give]|nr:purine-nucleoside phosphorylase [Salmonella enterica subsp. enterica serovar Give]